MIWRYKVGLVVEVGELTSEKTLSWVYKVDWVVGIKECNEKEIETSIPTPNRGGG